MIFVTGLIVKEKGQLNRDFLVRDLQYVNVVVIKQLCWKQIRRTCILSYMIFNSYVMRENSSIIDKTKDNFTLYFVHSDVIIDLILGIYC